MAVKLVEIETFAMGASWSYEERPPTERMALTPAEKSGSLIEVGIGGNHAIVQAKDLRAALDALVGRA